MQLLDNNNLRIFFQKVFSILYLVFSMQDKKYYLLYTKY
jgi:hypothetical protein